jgi:hypothetical protein
LRLAGRIRGGNRDGRLDRLRIEEGLGIAGAGCVEILHGEQRACVATRNRLVARIASGRSCRGILLGLSHRCRELRRVGGRVRSNRPRPCATPGRG